MFASTFHVSFLAVSLHYTLPHFPVIPFHVFATFFTLPPFSALLFFSPYPLTFLYVLCGGDLEHTGVLLLHFLRGRLFDIWKRLCAWIE